MDDTSEQSKKQAGTFQNSGAGAGQELRVERIGDATLYLGDCRTILPTIGKVDAVVTDPPFGVGNFVQVTGRIMGRGEGRGKPVKWNDCPPSADIFDMLKKISKHRIIWGANFFNCFEDRGGAIVWLKRQSMPNFSKADIASCTHFQKTEVVEIPWTNFTVAHQSESDHPCERPVALYSWCIGYLPRPCDTILDPYMGSGSVGVAAAKLGRKFIGIEIEPCYFDIACKRIDEAYRQGDMFIERPSSNTGTQQEELWGKGGASPRRDRKLGLDLKKLRRGTLSWPRK